MDFNQQEFNKICDGMEEINRIMCSEIEAAAPICHFRKMVLEQSESVDGYYTEWWECSVCGHIQDL